MGSTHLYFSFWGLIDLLLSMCQLTSVWCWQAPFLTVIRILRCKGFQDHKLGRYFSESQTLGKALYASSYKITVFLVAVLLVVITLGSVMYVVEGGNNGFSSIPRVFTGLSSPSPLLAMATLFL